MYDITLNLYNVLTLVLALDQTASCVPLYTVHVYVIQRLIGANTDTQMNNFIGGNTTFPLL